MLKIKHLSIARILVANVHEADNAYDAITTMALTVASAGGAQTKPTSCVPLATRRLASLESLVAIISTTMAIRPILC